MYENNIILLQNADRIKHQIFAVGFGGVDVSLSVLNHLCLVQLGSQNCKMALPSVQADGVLGPAGAAQLLVHK